MKLIKKLRLQQTTGKSVKLCEIDLCEQASRKDERFIVNVRTGNLGQALRESTKTPQPVTEAAANAVFHSIEVARRNEGYRTEQEDMAEAPTQVTVPAPANNDEVVQYLLRQLAPLASKNKSESPRRARIIWRLAELKDPTALPAIKPLLGRGEWIEDYCIAWAMGQLGDQHDVNDLHRLRASPIPAVRQLAFEAQLRLVPSASRAVQLQPLLESLPETMRNLMTAEETSALTDYLDTWLAQAGDQNSRLRDIYLLALVYPTLHTALCECVSRLPFKPGLFKGIRYLFKAAEFRRDSQLFGLLAHRIETTPAYFRGQWENIYLPGLGRINLSQELKSPNARLAFSQKTRDHFRRHCWRTLRRLGTANHADYVNMAQGVLLAMQDSDAQEPRHTKRYRWNRRERRQELVAQNRYDEFAPYLAFNHILHEHSRTRALSKSGRAWRLTQVSGDSSIQEQLRTDAFPHLWDQQPDALLTLLRRSRCEPVHRFATRALADNPSFCASLDATVLVELLDSHYSVTAQFSFDIIKKHAAEGSISSALVMALLKANLAEARQLAMNMLSGQQADLQADLRLTAGLLFARHEDVRTWFAGISQHFTYSDDAQCQLLSFICEEALNCQHDISLAQHVVDFIDSTLSSGVKSTALTHLSRLLASPILSTQWLGAQLLVRNQIGYSEVPATLMTAISDSPFSEVRAVAISLLNKQNDADLLKQPAQLINLFTQGDTSERQAVTPIILRLADAHEDFCQRCFDSFLPLAFQGEKRAGQHQDLENLLGKLQAHWGRINKDLLWRLLQAKSKAAQNIGAAVLVSRPQQSLSQEDRFSVKQWAHLAQHPLLQVRQWVWQTYADNADIVRQDLAAGLRIFNAHWADSRDAGMGFFSRLLTSAEWTPELIICLCDNQWEDVQRFGRDILLQHFDAEHGVDYLLKLSQHPSINVQLFVSGFLEEQAAGKPQVIRQLRPFFVDVLSRVNKGRHCKDRVLHFLVEQARASVETAQAVEAIFARQSATTVQRDRSQLLQAMVFLKQQYPTLTLPIMIQPARRSFVERLVEGER